MNNDLLGMFIPASLEYAHIGSRVYMPAQHSDYDFMFRPQDRDAVVERLNQLGVEFEVNTVGAIKFRLNITKPGRFTEHSFIEVNFCFVEDFDAWETATETMKILSQTLGTEFFTQMTKKKRLNLFSELVVHNGGTRPAIMRSF
jgi:hypothetical protein